jgi:hypothetical protein
VSIVSGIVIFSDIHSVIELLNCRAVYTKVEFSMCRFCVWYLKPFFTDFSYLFFICLFGFLVLDEDIGNEFVFT